MHTQNFILNYRRNGEVVEQLSKLMPKLNGVHSLAGIVKSVGAVDGLALVVTAQKEEVLWVLYLES